MYVWEGERTPSWEVREVMNVSICGECVILQV